MYRHRLSVVICHIADSDMAPASCVRKGKGEGRHVAHLYFVRCHCPSFIIVMCRRRSCVVGCCVASCVKKGKWDGGELT